MLLPEAVSEGLSTLQAPDVEDLLKGGARAELLPVVEAGEFRLDVPADGRALVVASAPLSIGAVPADVAKSRPSPSTIFVTMVDSKKAEELGLVGFGFQMEAAAAGTSVEVAIDYSKFRDLYGSDFVGRLRLVRFPACVLTDPKNPDCSTATVIDEASNDVARSVLTAITEVDSATGSPGPAVAAVGTDSTPAPAGSVPAATGGPPSAAAGEPATATAVTTVPAIATSTTSTIASTTSTAAPTAASAASERAVSSHGFGRGYRSGSGGGVIGLTSQFSSALGSFSATPLSSAASWSVGLSMGSFDWSYPVPVPPTGYGAAPSVSMSYSSSSVDGAVSDENTQGGFLGLGWSLNAGGFIERSYKTCTLDGSAINDFCWYSDNATIVLNGQSSEMYFTGVGDLNTWSEWRLKDDPGWKVVRSRGSASGPWDNLGEVWYVYAPDGTEYKFGQRFVSGSGEELQSVWHVPVYGNHVGEPCYGTSCQQAWRWNLDRVRDRFGNVTLYKYAAEVNFYGAGGSPWAPQAYVRGGYLSEIRYGIREGSEGSYRNIVRFNTKPRCFSDGTGGCQWYAAGITTPWYHDSPTDLRCSAAPCWKSAPGFWTERALDSIETFVYTPDQIGSGNYISNSSFEGGAGGWGVTLPPGGGVTNLAAYNQADRAKHGTWFLEANTSAGGGVGVHRRARRAYAWGAAHVDRLGAVPVWDTGVRHAGAVGGVGCTAEQRHQLHRDDRVATSDRVVRRDRLGEHVDAGSGVHPYARGEPQRRLREPDATVAARGPDQTND